MIVLTEKILNDAGGWQAMKHARALVETWAVTDLKHAPPLLTGTVRDGGASYRAGLKVSTATNIENLCTCRESREWGKICAHSLAVGWALIRPKAVPVQKPVEEPVRGPIFSTDGAGDTVVLHIVLPPSFVAAWEKNHVIAGVEAVCGGRRVLLQALNPALRFVCDEEDLRVIDKIRALNGGSVAGMLLLPRGKFLEFLGSLRGHPRVTFGKTKPAVVRTTALTPSLTIEPAADGGSVVRVGLLPDDGSLLTDGSLAWWLHDSDFQEVAPGLPPAYHELLRHEVRLSAQQAGVFFATELPGLRRFFKLMGEGGGAAPAIEPASPEFSLSVEGSLNHLAARLQATYGQRVVVIGITSSAENFTFSDPKAPGKFFTRNVPAEVAALEKLTRWGFSGPDTTGHFTLRGERQILVFFASEFPKLQRDWQVSVGSRFSNVTREIERLRPRIEVQGSGENWFEMQIGFGATGGEPFPAADIQRLLQIGQNSVRLKNGRLAVFDAGLLDELGEVLRDCNPEQIQPGRYRVHNSHAGYLDAMAGEGAVITGSEKWRHLARSQRQLEKVEPIALGNLEEVLRFYQKEGVYWMNFLSVNGFGGILADEMGLGKTIQALAFLAFAPKRIPGPSLVVCPSTLIHNWAREAGRFAPDLDTVTIEGSERGAQFGRIRDAGLVITSYALLRRDIERYRSIEFSNVILDEAQHIKNPDTQNALAASALHSRNRFVLTGTPMENSVRDLWSIMNFLMPGYLGSRDDFRERFELPILREDAKPVQLRLAKRLQPFMLRRLKRNVVKELPDKIEQVAYCELTTDQRTVYSGLLEQGRTQIESAAAENKGKAHLMMLTALLRMRQACCDLRLLNLPDLNKSRTSAKCDLLDELLQEAIDGGHRVLVFSQFATMLRILCERLDGGGIAFCHLDGQTTDRAAVVDRFQQSSDIPVFLISLKAGGVGLNLTAADTVIHFDPWWNPAVEAQATDRAHRIGQSNVVTSYKLIARDTVEEKILNLQRRKREWIDATIESDEPLMTGLSMDEICSLFE